VKGNTKRAKKFVPAYQKKKAKKRGGAWTRGRLKRIRSKKIKKKGQKKRPGNGY